MTDWANKKIQILSDNDRLSEVIELNLNGDFDVEILRATEKLSAIRSSQLESDSFDLIVAAMASYTSEPIVALARASLAAQIGKVSVSIVSERPYEFHPDDLISHLESSSDIDGIRDKAKEILQ